MNKTTLIYHEFTISGKIVLLDAFFSMQRLQQLFEYHEAGNSYRVSFAKVCFKMYEAALKDGASPNLTEDDFFDASDEELIRYCVNTMKVQMIF
jgi:hypothetical protein